MKPDTQRDPLQDFGFTISAYRAGQEAGIRALLEANGWPTHHVEIAAANAALYAACAECASLVACLDATPDACPEESVVGFVYVEHYFWNNLAQIQGLGVHPHQQRRGIATALMRAAEAFARSRGARGVFLDTPVDNLRGRGFYSAIGYHEAYRMPRYYDDDTDGVTFQHFFASGASGADAVDDGLHAARTNSEFNDAILPPPG